jgi:hypothetical protein
VTAARPLAVHTIAEFFATPLIGDRNRIKLVVDNERSKTVPKFWPFCLIEFRPCCRIEISTV